MSASGALALVKRVFFVCFFFSFFSFFFVISPYEISHTT